MRGWMGRRMGRPTLGQWPANHGRSLANWMRRSRRIGGRKIKESPLSALKRTPAIAAVVSRNPARSRSRTAREPTGTGLFFHRVLDWHLSATNSGHRTLLQAGNEQDCLRFSSPVCLSRYWSDLEVRVNVDTRRCLDDEISRYSMLSISATEAIITPEAANLLANFRSKMWRKKRRRRRRRWTDNVIGGIIEGMFKQLGLFLPAW